jgi:AraC-like DNA-binding protein
MLAWSPILIQRIEISALGFVLHKLQLNRHRDAEVSPHAHDCTQLILYLAGEGIQWIRGRRHEARGGDLFILPPHVPHGFSAVGGSRPLCLVLEYRTPRRGRRVAHRRLPQQTLNELHALLARVPTKGRPRLSDYPPILAVVARLLEPPRPASAPAAIPATPLFDRVRSGLADRRPLADVARSAGYARDSLSRRLKHDHGLSLRGLRDQLRLEQAQRALREGANVTAAGAAAGFDDPNYFARWFRLRTGLQPSVWRRHAGI